MFAFVAFLFVLGVLIFVHELGHFVTAKAVGIGVPRFSIGLGPISPLRFRRGETEYVVSWIPFGGYVKMASKEEQDDVEALEGGRQEQEFPPEKLFESKSVPARILVLSAGVVMNALFAWAVFASIALVHGMGEVPITRLDRVDADALPAAARALAELPLGAEIERVNGHEVETWDDVVEHILDRESASLHFDLAEGVGRVEIPVPGDDREARERIAGALTYYMGPYVGGVFPDKPAHVAGIEPGDRVVEIEGRPIPSWGHLIDALDGKAGEELELVVEREGEPERLTFGVTPIEEVVRDPLTQRVRKDPATGEPLRAFRIGIERRQPEIVYVRRGPVEAVVHGASQTWFWAKVVVFSLEGMIRGEISIRELGGPVMIAEVSGEAARAGLRYLLWFMAVLSVNLAVLNLLPIPVLDGGHLVFLVLEGLRGRPLPRGLRMRLTQVGLYLLLALMIFVVINDVLRLTSR